MCEGRAKKLAKNVGAWIVANAAPAMTGFVPRIWLQDTGSGFALVDRNRCDQFTLDHAQPLDTPLSLNTANGECVISETVPVQIGPTAEDTEALLLDNTPDVMSIGYRCVEKGYGFHWKPYSHKPFYYLPDGNVVTMFERGYVPYLADTLDNVACPAAVIPLAAEGNLVVAPPVPAASGGSPPADEPLPVPAVPKAPAGGRKVRALELSIKDRATSLEHVDALSKESALPNMHAGEDAIGSDSKPG